MILICIDSKLQLKLIIQGNLESLDQLLPLLPKSFSLINLPEYFLIYSTIGTLINQIKGQSRNKPLEEPKIFCNQHKLCDALADYAL